MLGECAQRLLESTARRNLAAALSHNPGPKSLLLDEALYNRHLSLARPLDLFVDATFLREHGIRTIAPLQTHTSRNWADILACDSLVIIIRGANAHAARAAVSIIRRLRADAEGKGMKELVLMTPRRSNMVEKVFREVALRDVMMKVLHFGFLPFDAELVTLDWPDAFRQVVLEGDNSAILACANGLRGLALDLGLEFVTIRTAGAAAAAVAEELLQTHGKVYGREEGRRGGEREVERVDRGGGFRSCQAFEREGEGEWGGAGRGGKRGVRLIVIDRGVDVVTALMMQWTYEGLLDEAVGLHNNVMDLPVGCLVSEDAIGILKSGPNASGSGGTVRKRLRGDVDAIFGRLRDLNYWSAARQIGSVASSVREYYERRPGRDTADISQVKDYVRGLKEVKSEHWSAAVHMALAAEISARTFDEYEFKKRFELEREMIEGNSSTSRRVYMSDIISQGDSLSHVLRLCCLWSLTSSGMDGEDMDFVKRELVAIFGLGVLSLLANLERARMLVRSAREMGGGQGGWMPFSTNFSGGSESGSSVTRSESGARKRGQEYSWQFARAALRLVTDFDPEQTVLAGSIAASAAPYSGYTPLSVRLVEAGLSENGWDSLPHIVAHTSLLPGGHAVVEHCKGEEADGEDDQVDAVVVFVGGIARAEASAVRAALRLCSLKGLICTTAVMGPDEFVLSLKQGLF